MKKLSVLTNVVMLAGAMVLLARGVVFALPGPPPGVPAGDPYTQFAVGGGIAAYGAYQLWKAKRSVKKHEKEQRGRSFRNDGGAL